MGTPLYMAPEALGASGGVNARTDLYALGGVAYFLLTGTPVFRGATVIEIFSQILSTPPEPPSVRLGRPIPSGLEEVVLQCLAKSPADRPPDARALQRTLASLCQADWSTDHAARWWAQHRETLRAVTRPPAAPPPMTVAADLEGRLAGK